MFFYFFLLFIHHINCFHESEKIYYCSLIRLAAYEQQNGFLQRLEFVRVRDCGDVRPPFPAKLLRALNNLKEVIVDSCNSVKDDRSGSSFSSLLPSSASPNSNTSSNDLQSSISTLQIFHSSQQFCWKRSANIPTIVHFYIF